MSRVFSRSTTSSPRRKISTSSLSKRNSFGKRTAWLLPGFGRHEPSTYALSLKVYTKEYIHVVGFSRSGRHKDSRASGYDAARVEHHVVFDNGTTGSTMRLGHLSGIGSEIGMIKYGSRAHRLVVDTPTSGAGSTAAESGTANVTCVGGRP